MDMNLKQQRVLKICEDLGKYTRLQTVPITRFQMKKAKVFTPEEADACDIPWQDFDPAKDVWSGPDEHYWFRTTVTIPESFAGKTLWVAVATQVRFWDAVNPQFLAFVDGAVVQGLDCNHREIRLFKHAKAGDTFTLDLQAYTGRDNDRTSGTTAGLRLFAELVEFDAPVNALLYNLMVPCKMVKHLDENHPLRSKLQNAMEHAINLIDFRVPQSDAFHASLEEANAYLDRVVYNELTGNEDVIATCIGSTHIDIAWWWTVEQTREKAARSFATALKLMEEYPDYKFMSSQPQLYEFVKERYPALYERIRQRVKEGRWEAEGGMWIEADCNVTSGESLIRQFLYGKRFIKEEFDKDSKVLWLPDVFGYSAALPQIMKKCGIEYFMTTKISWNQYNKLPVDTFWWKGIDGTEIFTHLITAQEEGQPKESFNTGYGVRLQPITVAKTWERYQQKDINNDVLLSYGHSDGGGGPTRDMIENGIRLKKGFAGIGKVRMELVKPYFDELKERCLASGKMPRWDGELYLEYHRGTYTSMARNKKANRKSEYLYQDLEFYADWAKKYGADYPTEMLRRNWKTILVNQFHDILPGSSIHEVYEVTKEEYEQLQAEGNAVIADDLKLLAANASGAKAKDVVVFNSLSFERDDCVTVGAEDYAGVTAFADADGNTYPVQKTADGAMLFRAENIPAKGMSVYTPCEGKLSDSTPFTITEDKISTPYYDITLDEAYQFISVYDKENDREVLTEGERGNVLMVYEDKPIYYDNWDIDIYYDLKYWAVEDVQNAEWIEVGPVRAVLQITRKFLESTIVQKIIFYANDRRIDFDTYVDWKQFNLLLKVLFPVDINAKEATFDIQFGNLTRPTHKNTSWDAAKFETCGHKWADVSEGNYGVSILNDCKYGYGIHEGVIGLTLLKSGILPNPTTDQEEHTFTYALLPHQGSWKEADVVQQAYRLNVPVRSVCMEQDAKADAKQYLKLSTADGRGNVVLETVKQAENGEGTIVRVFECKNMRTKVKLTVPAGVTQAAICDMLENAETAVPVENGAVEFTIRPYEIMTFLFK